FAEVGQGNKCFDSPDNATHTERFGALGEHRQPVDIEAEHVVAEQLGDVSEIARAAADIEDAFARGDIEAGIADALDVDVDPTGEIEILRPIFTSGIIHAPAVVHFLELRAVDRCDNRVRFEFHRQTPVEHPVTDALTGAAECAPAHDLRHFFRKTHRRTGYIAVLAGRRNFN